MWQLQHKCIQAPSANFAPPLSNILRRSWAASLPARPAYRRDSAVLMQADQARGRNRFSYQLRPPTHESTPLNRPAAGRQPARELIAARVPVQGIRYLAARCNAQQPWTMHSTAELTFTGKRVYKERLSTRFREVHGGACGRIRNHQCRRRLKSVETSESTQTLHVFVCMYMKHKNLAGTSR